MHLQYITQDLKEKSHPELAEEACRAGINWVQLRVKNKSYEEWQEIARQIKEVTDKFSAKLIINDSLEIALAVKAHGVHLGLSDLPVLKAKELAPKGFIIGGTANTFEDIKIRVMEGVDYIGLGPFRFTTTKKKLSPTLGVEGYKTILQQCISKGIAVPIIAIGGIVPEDVPELMRIGLSGIAISSAISLAKDKKKIVEEFRCQMLVFKC